MFRRNSAFTATSEELEYLEGVRKRALTQSPVPPQSLDLEDIAERVADRLEYGNAPDDGKS